MLTSPLDGCPERPSSGKDRRALSQATPQPSLWGPRVSPPPTLRWGSGRSLLLKEEGTACWLKILTCCVTSGKSLPLSGPWSPVSEMRRAKIFKFFQNSDTLGSCRVLGVLGKRIGMGGLILGACFSCYIAEGRRGGGRAGREKEPQGLQVAVIGGKASLSFWKHIYF